MPLITKKQGKTDHVYPTKAEVLRKLDKATHRAAESTILTLLKKQGAEELSLDEVRKRLSVLKTPLSVEIIAERKKS